MATTQEILTAARELGKLIATHPAAVKFENIVKKLQADVEAQRLMTDLNRHIEALGEKEANGQPIEVADKRKLEELQNKMITHPLLSQFQMVQMDYVDLMRQVDEAMSGTAPGAEADPLGGAGGLIH
jgi:cell fate (sporulation/competence/biofilm development) regulator YlbF (YheA/YmcA/DUF963 family)